MERTVKSFLTFIAESKFSDRKPGKEGLLSSKTFSKEMKEKVLPYVSSETYYYNKKVLRLVIPKIEGKSFDGVDLGADKDGFSCLLTELGQNRTTRQKRSQTARSNSSNPLGNLE